MKTRILLFFLLIVLEVQSQSVIAPDNSGIALKKYYLNLKVEEKWLPGHHINWETGEVDDLNATREIKTHCSAFAAAAAAKLNIYMLRPPEHPQELLSNAQFRWFQTKQAKEKGWIELKDDKQYESAQNFANKGYIVVAVYGNSDPKKPGHIALIIPDNVTDADLMNTGPKIIMAGQINYNTTNLKWGFRYHIKIWPEHEILFFYNEHKPF